MLKSRCGAVGQQSSSAPCAPLHSHWRGVAFVSGQQWPRALAAGGLVVGQQHHHQQHCWHDHNHPAAWRGRPGTSRGATLATHAASSRSAPGGGSSSDASSSPATLVSASSSAASTTTTTAAAAAGGAGSPSGGSQPGQQPQSPQAGGAGGPAAGASAVRYSPLHYNIEEFCQRVVPSEDERKYRTQVVELVRTHTRKAMAEAGRRCDVQVFGSFVTGLSTWSSDVDLVVTGVMEPDRHTGVYDVADRGRVVGRLRRIGEALRRCKKLDNPRISIIPRARIPIIKLKVRNVNVDISISDDTGPRAARHMAQQVRAYPPMRPLVLVLKAYLKSVHLNEVMTGGLSSYSLCNMVVAHLQEELKAGRDIFDFGEALYAFLLRYGEEFDYANDAVSIESGGIVAKHALGIATDYYPSAGGPGLYDRLAVDCPVTGRDVSNGTYRIDAVRAAFQRAARRLEALARGRRVDDLTVNYLQALFDVQRVLKRAAGGEDDDGLGGYGAAFDQVFGRGTSPEIIQLDPPPRNLRGLDLDEEELLMDDSGLDDDVDDDDEWEEAPGQGAGGRGGRGHRGGPRGKGSR